MSEHNCSLSMHCFAHPGGQQLCDDEVVGRTLYCPLRTPMGCGHMLLHRRYDSKRGYSCSLCTKEKVEDRNVYLLTALRETYGPRCLVYETALAAAKSAWSFANQRHTSPYFLLNHLGLGERGIPETVARLLTPPSEHRYVIIQFDAGLNENGSYSDKDYVGYLISRNQIIPSAKGV